MDPPLIELDRVEKDYHAGSIVVRALLDVTLHVGRGELVAIVGASGSGKSTMMNILGCLDRPTRGRYRLDRVEVGNRSGDGRAIVRNRLIGFVFQGYNLLPRASALENVELPLVYRGIGRRERRERARAALAQVGLGHRAHPTPNQLSGGQQQRVAIARALLQQLNRDGGITILLATHEPSIAACASRIVTMRDGRILSDAKNQALDAAELLADLGGVNDLPDSA